MARYDYRCCSCGNIEEHEHGMNESPTIMCMECGAYMRKHFGKDIAKNVLRCGHGKDGAMSDWEEIKTR